MSGKSGNRDNLPSEIDVERERFEAYLASRGLRLTEQRRAIFEEVFRHHGHLDAEELVGRLRAMGKQASRATVYRTLDLLVEAGLVKPLRLTTEQRYFEHVHAGEHHDHLVCIECNRIFEFYSEELEECQARICDETDFTPKRHTMVIYGICSECRKKTAT